MVKYTKQQIIVVYKLMDLLNAFEGVSSHTFFDMEEVMLKAGLQLHNEEKKYGVRKI